MPTDPDSMLLLGLLLAILSIPSILSAFSEQRPPRVAAIVLVAAGILIVLAFRRKEGGYTLAEIPMVIYAYIGSLMH